MIRLDHGGRRVKSRIRTGNVAAFIPENSAYNHAISVESISSVAGGSQWERAQQFKVGRLPDKQLKRISYCYAYLTPDRLSLAL